MQTVNYLRGRSDEDVIALLAQGHGVEMKRTQRNRVAKTVSDTTETWVVGYVPVGGTKFYSVARHPERMKPGCPSCGSHKLYTRGPEGDGYSIGCYDCYQYHYRPERWAR